MLRIAKVGEDVDDNFVSMLVILAIPPDRVNTDL